MPTTKATQRLQGAIADSKKPRIATTKTTINTTPNPVVKTYNSDFP